MRDCPCIAVTYESRTTTLPWQCSWMKRFSWPSGESLRERRYRPSLFSRSACTVGGLQRAAVNPQP